MQVQQGREWAGADDRARFQQRELPSGIGRAPGGAANRGILVGHLAVQDDLGGGVIADLLVSQERHQALLQGAKAAFDLAFGFRAWGDQMGDAQGREGTLELGAGIAIIGHGIMAKEAEAIGVDDQGQAVLLEEAAKMLEVIPGGIGGDKDRAQEFSRVIIDGQQEGLFGGSWPPLVDGGIVLPEFAQASSLPTAAGFGTGFRLADELWEMGPDKRGHGLPMALEAKAASQFVGHQLKIGRFLQGDKGFEELDRFGGPIGPVAAAGELRAELGPVLDPAGALTRGAPLLAAWYLS